MDQFMTLDRFTEVVRTAREGNKASAALFQRRLRVGYAVAAKYVDLMEDTNLCSLQDGARPRVAYLDQISDKEAAQKMLDNWNRRSLS